MAANLPTTRDWFERVKTETKQRSAYGVAKVLGVHPKTARNWEMGRTTLDARGVELIASALGVDAGYVALTVLVERETNDNLSRAMTRVMLAVANG